MKYTIFFLFTICLLNAQQQKITTKEYNLIGKVKLVLETAEQQGDLITVKERNNKNIFFSDEFKPIIGQFTFNEEGKIIEKRGFQNINQKTIYEYDASNKLNKITIYNSKLSDNINTPISEVNYSYKKDTIITTNINLEDKTVNPLIVTQVYKNNQLVQEYTQQKSINYYYDNFGTLIKKEGFKKNKPIKNNSENYQIIYENGVIISSYCPENNILNTYYPNGLLKTSTTEFRFQENVYNYDQKGNWIISTVTLDGKPSIKYYRIIEYY